MHHLRYEENFGDNWKIIFLAKDIHVSCTLFLLLIPKYTHFIILYYSIHIFSNIYFFFLNLLLSVHPIWKISLCYNNGRSRLMSRHGAGNFQQHRNSGFSISRFGEQCPRSWLFRALCQQRDYKGLRVDESFQIAAECFATSLESA